MYNRIIALFNYTRGVLKAMDTTNEYPRAYSVSCTPYATKCSDLVKSIKESHIFTRVSP